jgi:hypothetical protein
VRITRAHLEAKVSIINGMLGFDHNTVGSIQLYHSTGYNVHRVHNESYGVESLSVGGTATEASHFLQGMIAALRIVQVTK